MKTHVITLIMITIFSCSGIHAGQLGPISAQDRGRLITFLGALRRNPLLPHLDSTTRQHIAEFAVTPLQEITVENHTAIPLRIRISKILNPSQYTLYNDITLDQGIYSTGKAFGNFAQINLPIAPLRISVLNTTPAPGHQYGYYFGSIHIGANQLHGLQRIGIEYVGIDFGNLTLYYIDRNPETIMFKPPPY